MDRQSKVTIGLIVSTRESTGGFFHIELHTAVIGPNASERARPEDYPRVDPERVRNAPDTLVNGLYLDDLVVSCQADTDYSRKPYGFEIRYKDCYSVDLRKAKLMAKTLGTIDRAMSKAYNQNGNASTFGEYVVRAARAIGASVIVSKSGPAYGWGHDGQNYNHGTISDGRYHIDRLVAGWEDKGKPAALPAPAAAPAE